MKVKVIVSLKEGVLDPQAKAIHHALQTCGFAQVENVKLSKEIILDIQDNNKVEVEKSAHKMCKELLANTVIEDYKVEIL